MVIDELRNIKSDAGELRKFAIVMTVALALLGAILLWREKGYYYWFFIVAGVFLVCGFIKPIFLKPAQKLWMGFAVIMGWFMSRVILGVLFYVLFTLTNLIARLFGKRFLELSINSEAGSYWIVKETNSTDASKFDTQF